MGIVKTIRDHLSRVRFALGLNPHVERTDNFRRYIPEPFQSVVLISADFELAWAWRYAKYAKSPLSLAKYKAGLERENIPKILTLCEKFDIPVTWLTVGHLFLTSCIRENGIAHGELPRLPHFENNYWQYSGDDWFEHDPCTDLHTDPNWYCPDLIDRITGSGVKHEIGCHTFSHIDCRDSVCTPDILRAELQLCRYLAQERKIELKSFVHPGFTVGNLNTLAGEGFNNFRTDYRNVLGYPKKHENGLWEFEQTAEFMFRKGWSVDYHIHRYRTIIERAVKSNTVCVLWFHPSFDPVVVDKILPEVFCFINKNRNRIWVTTHSGYVDWLVLKSAVDLKQLSGVACQVSGNSKMA